MKKIATLFILFCICISLNAQQSLQLEVNKVWGADSPDNSFALTWYRADGITSGYVLRLGYLSTETQPNYENFSKDHIQLDVIKRWYNSSPTKVSLFGELGISGMVTNENRGYYYGSCCSFCDCLFAPISIAPDRNYERNQKGGIDYKKDDKYYSLFFLPGASAGSGLNVNFTKHFSMALQCRVNTYYSVGEEELLSYFHCGLNAGFRF